MIVVGRALLAYLADGDYETTQARYAPADLLAGLVSRYGGTDADRWALEVEDIERRLDREWPDWRIKKPYGMLPEGPRGRIALLLTRRWLILIGRAHWGLKLVRRADGRVIPVQVRPAYAPQVHAREPKTSINPRAPKLSIPSLAVKAGVKLSRAKVAMATFDAAIEPNQLTHIREWCAANPEEAPDAHSP